MTWVWITLCWTMKASGLTVMCDHVLRWGKQHEQGESSSSLVFKEVAENDAEAHSTQLLCYGTRLLFHSYFQRRCSKSQNHRMVGSEGAWKIISFHPLLYPGTPSMRSGCSKPHPAWTLPGMLCEGVLSVMSAKKGQVRFVCSGMPRSALTWTVSFSCCAAAGKSWRGSFVWLTRCHRRRKVKFLLRLTEIKKVIWATSS